MTDITELAQREKFEAWLSEKPPYARYMHWCDSLNAYDYTGIQLAWEAYQAGGDELVEALEKAQAKNALVAGGIEASTKLHERIAELESQVKFPGVMRCNTCGFSRSHVIVTPGGMLAGESEPEHCPNGCGPLWHETYRRQYNELYDAYKELESRTVKLPGWFVKDAIAVYDRDEIEEALAAAGIKWEAE